MLLSGEPGIGKSRILSALRERLEGRGAQPLHFQCSPYFINSALWPSIDNFERALKFGRGESPEAKLDKLYAIGQDVKVTACAWLSNICIWTGDLEQAYEYASMSIEHARAIGHPFSLAVALSIGSIPLSELGGYDEALRLTKECKELCEAQSIPFWKAWGMVSEGVALAGKGQYALAVDCLAQARAQLRATGARSAEGYIDAWRAIALAKDGHFEDARREAEDGRLEALRSGERMHLPWASYAHGLIEVLDPNGNRSQAERWMQVAIAEAQLTGAHLLQLRAGTALARHWRSQGRTREARDLLAPIYDAFTDGFDTKDLKEAKTLLEELR